jgi:hypothetical protein
MDNFRFVFRHHHLTSMQIAMQHGFRIVAERHLGGLH